MLECKVQICFTLSSSSGEKNNLSYFVDGKLVTAGSKVYEGQATTRKLQNMFFSVLLSLKRAENRLSLFPPSQVDDVAADAARLAALDHHPDRVRLHRRRPRRQERPVARRVGRRRGLLYQVLSL